MEEVVDLSLLFSRLLSKLLLMLSSRDSLGLGVGEGSLGLLKGSVAFGGDVERLASCGGRGKRGKRSQPAITSQLY